MTELSFTDGKILNSPSRPFNCSVCLKTSDATAKIRQCSVERYDFTERDNPTVFPIRIQKNGGGTYGFCPAKSTWDVEANSLFRLLLVAAETGAMYVAGGLSEQPSWFVEMLGWFVPQYDNLKFASRAKSVLGEPKQNQGANIGNRTRRPSNHDQAGFKRRK